MLSKEAFSFDEIDEDLVLIDLTNRANLEAVVVTSGGIVILFDLALGKSSEIGKLTFDSFSPELRHPFFPGNIQLHSFHDYISVTHVYGSFGTVLDLGNPKFSKSLDRGNYHPEVSRFPVAFFPTDDDTFLIHATDWNRLDITRLKSNELLTDRIVDCETNENYFDYFHCGLSVAPDSKSFVSNGWYWHPFGQITWYSIERFLREFELSHVNLELTDNLDPEGTCIELGWDRPICWIDSNTMGIGYNRAVGYYGQKKDFLSEILVYDLKDSRVARRIEFDGFAIDSENEVKGDLFFDVYKQQFIALNNTKGLLITDIDGQIVASTSELWGWKYNISNKRFYRTNEKDKRVEIAYDIS